MNHKVKIYEGQKFGKWTAIKEITYHKDKDRIYWQVQCECGKIATVRASNLNCNKSTCCSVCSGVCQKLKPFSAIFNNLVRSANERNILVSITYEDYLNLTRQKLCHYCCAELNWLTFTGNNKERQKGCGYNIDRKDCLKGYELDNIVVCCKRCNRGKMNLWSYDEWMRMTECFREDFKRKG